MRWESLHGGFCRLLVVFPTGTAAAAAAAAAAAIRAIGASYSTCVTTTIIYTAIA